MRIQREFDRVNLHRLTTDRSWGWTGPPPQGLTLVHFSAQLEPCLTQNNTLHTLNTP